jgi:hypothetical protein
VFRGQKLMTEPFGEVIASSSQELQVECHQLYRAPAFGSFVRAECIGSGTQFYGVVTQVATAPLDGNRVVQAHGMPPGELEQRKPHLVDLLRTTFSVRVVGYGQGDARVAGTPPTPPRLHCFVSPASEDEVRGMTASPAFLRPLSQVVDAPLEDLLAGALQHARDVWPTEEQHWRLVAWGKFLARLLRDDYLTLEGVLQRLTPATGFPVAPRPARLTTVAEEPRTTPLYERPIPLAGGASSDPFDF